MFKVTRATMRLSPDIVGEAPAEASSFAEQNRDLHEGERTTRGGLEDVGSSATTVPAASASSRITHHAGRVSAGRTPLEIGTSPSAPSTSSAYSSSSSAVQVHQGEQVAKQTRNKFENAFSHSHLHLHVMPVPPGTEEHLEEAAAAAAHGETHPVHFGTNHHPSPSWDLCGVTRPIVGPLNIAHLFVLSFLFFCFLCCLCHLNWRRFPAIKNFLFSIGWDKFQAIDLVINVHSLKMLNPHPEDKGVYSVKIIAGGKDYWTPDSKNGVIEKPLDVRILQGYRSIVIEVWVVTGGLFRTKHRMAHRILDVMEMVIARRSFGCVRHEAFSVVKKADGSAITDSFQSGKVVLSIQYKADVDKQSSDEITRLEHFIEHPISAPVAAEVSKHLATMKDLKGNAEYEAVLKILRQLLQARVKWVSRFGIPRTKFANVFQKKTSAGKLKWHFGIFHREADRLSNDTSDAKVLCSILTISAVVTDPKHPNYVCLRYLTSRKGGNAVDLYFQIIDSPLWIEAMHLFIEVVRRMRRQAHGAVANV
ncbi:unnamed protein product [Amoebophrya sp. A120]|nr:unnamed protein product [Amoebophrya sp. A120]|eukprot:GSA120T00012935001.1